MNTPKTYFVRRQKKYSTEGFAVVVSLILMSMIVLVSLMLYSSLQVEVQAVSNHEQQMKARANARLSLLTALGQLQAYAGPDTRVTATAEAVDDVNGSISLTGVWRSWEGLNHESTGSPIAPDYSSKLEKGDLGPSSDSSNRFLTWLLSSEFDGSATSASSTTSLPSLAETTSSVALLAAGTLGVDANTSSNLEVHVEPTLFEGGEGATAWWITGENTKAFVDAKEETTDAVGWSERLASMNGVDESVFGFSSTDNMDRVITRSNLDLLPNSGATNQRVSGKYFYDLTANARGLLTNSATGGWRRDLSLMSENWSQLNASDFDFFTLEPGVGTLSPNNLIYPWGAVQSRNDTSVSWNALVDFATQYKNIETSNSQGNVIFPQSVGNTDQVNRYPVFAQFHCVVSLSAKLDTGTGQYKPCLVMNPVFTLWNPYSVALRLSSFRFNVILYEPVPFRYQVEVGGNTYNLSWGDLMSGNARVRTTLLSSDDPVWQPGEARMYSATRLTDINPDDSQGGYVGNVRLDLDKGYRTDVGFRFELRDPGDLTNAILGDADDLFGVNQVTTDAVVRGHNGRGVGYELQISRDGEDSRLNFDVNPVEDRTLFMDDAVAVTVDPVSLLDAADFPVPFCSAILGLRFIQDINEDDSHTSSNGWAHMNPLLSSYDKGEGVLSYRFGAMPHSWTFFSINGTTLSPGLPSGLPGESVGFLGTSFDAQEGLTHLVIAEVPMRPLLSLGELQHFDVNGTNKWPPFTMNAIGNSSASPFIGADKVNVGSITDFGHDHSYVSNHLFFDDWFVSSIAPRVSAWSGEELASMQEVYADHLSGKQSLSNHQYAPARILDEASSQALADTYLNNDDSWLTVASEIEVKGMFNINSTSVKAWEALLRHFRDVEVPRHSITSVDDWEVVLDNNSANVVSRTTVAGDRFSNPDPLYGQFASYAELTDTQMTLLATEIVEQVKKRGPFLSLSEFVNRRLTTVDDELALGGAIEVALSKLAEGSGAENPYSSLQSAFQKDAVLPADAATAYPFVEAAEGSTAYGFPGWIRQADILRPIAPVLSVRDDTFTIRAYGDSRDPLTGKVVARSWCEAVVQRRADYVDDADENTVLPSVATLDSVANQFLGRRFEIIYFRWLNEDDV